MHKRKKALTPIGGWKMRVHYHCIRQATDSIEYFVTGVSLDRGRDSRFIHQAHVKKPD